MVLFVHLNGEGLLMIGAMAVNNFVTMNSAPSRNIMERPGIGTGYRQLITAI